MKKALLTFLSLVLLTSIGGAQEIFRVRVSVDFSILRNEKVLKELGIDGKDYKKFQELSDKILEGMMVQVEGGGDVAEVQQQIQEQIRSGENAGMASLKKALTSTQLERFKQLSLQRMGTDSLGIPSVQEKLRLTAEQKAMVERELTEFNALSNEIYQDAEQIQKGDSTYFKLSKEQEAKLIKAKNASLARVVGTFTDEQKQNWRKLIGDPFEFE